MSLPDAAAELARQLVTALAGDAGRLESAEARIDAEVRQEAELNELRDYVKAGEEKQQLLIVERDRLRGAVQEVLRQEGDLLTADRAQLLRDAMGEPEQDLGPDRWPGGRRVSHAEAIRVNVTSKTAARLKYVTRQRDDLLAAAQKVFAEPFGPTLATRALRQVVDQIRREAQEEG